MNTHPTEKIQSDTDSTINVVFPGGNTYGSGHLDYRGQKDQKKKKGFGAEEAPPSASAYGFRALRTQIQPPRPDDRGHNQQRDAQSHRVRDQRLSDSFLDRPHLEGRTPKGFAGHIRNVAL